MILILISILGIISLFFRNEKNLLVLWLILLWSVFWINLSSPDRYMYNIIYSTPEMAKRYEKGFAFLVQICNSIHMGFSGFLAVCAFIGFIFMYKAVDGMSINRSFIFLLYFLWPFMLDVEQIRSFIGTSIVLFGFSYIYNHKDDTIQKNIVIYISSCMVAALFQTSCILYIVYVIVFFSKRMIKMTIAVFLILLTFFRTAVVHFISSIVNSGLSLRVMHYMYESKGKDNWYIYVIYNVFMLVFVLFLCYKYTIKNKKLIIKINIISMVLIPFLYFDPSFERLFRFIIIIDYIVIGNLIGTKITKYRDVFLLFFVLAFAGLRFFALAFGQGWENYFIPYFFQNTILK